MRDRAQAGVSALTLVVLLVVLAAAAAFGYRVLPSQRQSRALEAAKEAEAAQQRDAVAATTKMLELSNRWSDASRLASSTSRVALSGPVASLQALQREASSMQVPPCLEQSRKHLAEAMRLDVEAFLAFMVDSTDMGRVRSIELHTKAKEQEALATQTGWPFACKAVPSQAASASAPT